MAYFWGIAYFSDTIFKGKFFYDGVQIVEAPTLCFQEKRPKQGSKPQARKQARDRNGECLSFI